MSVRPRSRLWWYLRFRKAYRLHGAVVGRRRSWKDAQIARSGMAVEEQRNLGPIKGPYKRGELT